MLFYNDFAIIILNITDQRKHWFKRGQTSLLLGIQLTVLDKNNPKTILGLIFVNHTYIYMYSIKQDRQVTIIYFFFPLQQFF